MAQQIILDWIDGVNNPAFTIDLDERLGFKTRDANNNSFSSVFDSQDILTPSTQGWDSGYDGDGQKQYGVYLLNSGYPGSTVFSALGSGSFSMSATNACDYDNGSDITGPTGAPFVYKIITPDSGSVLTGMSWKATSGGGAGDGIGAMIINADNDFAMQCYHNEGDANWTVVKYKSGTRTVVDNTMVYTADGAGNFPVTFTITATQLIVGVTGDTYTDVDSDWTAEVSYKAGFIFKSTGPNGSYGANFNSLTVTTGAAAGDQYQIGAPSVDIYYKQTETVNFAPSATINYADITVQAYRDTGSFDASTDLSLRVLTDSGQVEKAMTNTGTADASIWKIDDVGSFTTSTLYFRLFPKNDYYGTFTPQFWRVQVADPGVNFYTSGNVLKGT